MHPSQPMLDPGWFPEQQKGFASVGLSGSLAEDLRSFCGFGQPTRIVPAGFAAREGCGGEVWAYVNEFWTARQRQANALHEVSYRACFKPQLPRFFIERLTQPGGVVYDPFMGRGTTPIEAALLGRVPWGNDANPLSIMLTRPRLRPPTLEEVEARLRKIPLEEPADLPDELHVFFHPQVLRAVSSLKRYLLKQRDGGRLDPVDEWIGLVALNRLTGHSAGFFSVYTLPPNQAVSVRSQGRINERRAQVPPPRDVRRIILKKSRQLLSELDEAARARLSETGGRARLFTGPAQRTPSIPDDSVDLVVTSPPFLNVVQYGADNWLRCWFLGIDEKSVRLTVPVRMSDWRAAMAEVFEELKRVLKPGGHVAFEVGEIRRGSTKLETEVLPCGVAAGLEPVLVLINEQQFTKTANCWGIDNMSRGTNTNRVVVFQKR